jgi:hypothetical protein
MIEQWLLIYAAFSLCLFLVFCAIWRHDGLLMEDWGIEDWGICVGSSAIVPVGAIMLLVVYSPEALKFFTKERRIGKKIHSQSRQESA